MKNWGFLLLLVVSAFGVSAQPNFSSSRVRTGVYSIAFNSAFTENPRLTANAQTTVPRVVTTPNVTATGAGIRIFFMDDVALLKTKEGTH